MNQVQVEQKTYQMPRRTALQSHTFSPSPTSSDRLDFTKRSSVVAFLSRGDSKGAPGYIQIANTWLIVNVGGGPTPDKPSVTLSVPADPDSVNSFMNIRVADIQACYELWRSRGAEFITEPMDKYGETRCYIRDPDGYIIEVGQKQAGLHLRLDATTHKKCISLVTAVDCRRREIPEDGLNFGETAARRSFLFAPNLLFVDVRFWHLADMRELHCTCPLSGGKADMAVGRNPLARSLLRVKRTSAVALHMSAFDPKRTFPAEAVRG